MAVVGPVSTVSDDDQSHLGVHVSVQGTTTTVGQGWLLCTASLPIYVDVCTSFKGHQAFTLSSSDTSIPPTLASSTHIRYFQQSPHPQSCVSQPSSPLFLSSWAPSLAPTYMSKACASTVSAVNTYTTTPPQGPCVKHTRTETPEASNGINALTAKW